MILLVAVCGIAEGGERAQGIAYLSAPLPPSAERTLPSVLLVGEFFISPDMAVQQFKRRLFSRFTLRRPKSFVVSTRDHAVYAIGIWGSIRRMDHILLFLAKFNEESRGT